MAGKIISTEIIQNTISVNTMWRYDLFLDLGLALASFPYLSSSFPSASISS